MSDVADVLEANAAFYRAFESLDVKRMEEVWLRAPYIKCVHPGWGLLVGSVDIRGRDVGETDPLARRGTGDEEGCEHV